MLLARSDDHDERRDAFRIPLREPRRLPLACHLDRHRKLFECKGGMLLEVVFSLGQSLGYRERMHLRV